MPDPRGRPDYSAFAKASTLTAALISLTVGGYWLDQHLRTSFVFTLIGGGLGLFYCCYEAWRMLNSDEDRHKKTK